MRKDAQVWETLRHRNVLPFLGVINLRGEVYLVSPWMDYGDVATFTAKRQAYLQLPRDSVHRKDYPHKEAYNTFRERDIVSTLSPGLRC